MSNHAITNLSEMVARLAAGMSKHAVTNLSEMVALVAAGMSKHAVMNLSEIGSFGWQLSWLHL